VGGFCGLYSEKSRQPSKIDSYRDSDLRGGIQINGLWFTYAKMQEEVEDINVD